MQAETSLVSFFAYAESPESLFRDNSTISIKSSPTVLTCIYTVNLEYCVIILFSRKTLKEIFATLKNARLRTIYLNQ